MSNDQVHAIQQVQAMQIQQLTDTMTELRTANSAQMAFNTEVVRFMSAVTTWGKVGMLLWSVFAALLVWAITQAG